VNLVLTLALSLASFASSAWLGASHPGHGSTVVMGTLVSVSSTTVTIEVRDLATTSIRTVQVRVNDDTKYRVGKEPVSSPSTYVGTRAVAVVDYEEGPDGQPRYTATEVRLTKPKSKP
jgi:hypothetical protein